MTPAIKPAGAEDAMSPISLDRRAALTGAGALAAAGLMGARTAAAQARMGSLCFLSLSNNVMTVGPDGQGLAKLVEGKGSSGPDGITYDTSAKRIIWSNMGKVNENDGTVMSCDLAGGDVKTLVAAGGTFTPKQIKFDTERRRLYWCDREGMRVMRCNPDGSNVEVLVQTGDFTANKGDQTRWCVGIALDYSRNQIYWSQKGGDNANQGVIRRASMDIPYGQTPANRTDIETLFSGLPEPIDLDIEPRRRRLYWTDRGDNTVSRAPMDMNILDDPAARTDREILVRGLKEAIGMHLDTAAGRMYYTSLGGEVGTAKMDGTEARMLLTGQGSLTGITQIALSSMS